MPESIERLVRGFSVLRLLSIATLLLIAACIIVGATIALADSPHASALLTPAAEDLGAIDIYEFDFAVAPEKLPHPEFDELATYRDI